MTMLPSFISLVPYCNFLMLLAVLRIERERERERKTERERERGSGRDKEDRDTEIVERKIKVVTN